MLLSYIIFYTVMSSLHTPLFWLKRSFCNNSHFSSVNCSDWLIPMASLCAHFWKGCWVLMAVWHDRVHIFLVFEPFCVSNTLIQFRHHHTLDMPIGASALNPSMLQLTTNPMICQLSRTLCSFLALLSCFRVWCVPYWLHSQISTDSYSSIFTLPNKIMGLHSLYWKK